MLHLIQLILQNLTFFALHLKNLTSFPKPLSAKRELELLHKMKHQVDSEARTELIEHIILHVSSKMNTVIQDNYTSVKKVNNIKFYLQHKKYAIIFVANTQKHRRTIANPAVLTYVLVSVSVVFIYSLAYSLEKFNFLFIREALFI